MTPPAILSLCILFIGGWNLAAGEHADQCISPIICNGEPSWIETSKVISTCHKPCESCDVELKKAKDTIDGMMRELKEDFESVAENVRKIVEPHSTDVSTQQETTSSPTPTSDSLTTDVTTQSSETTDSVSESISSTTDPDTSLATSIATTSEAATMSTTEAATISTSEAATTTEGTSVSESISPSTDPDTPVAISITTTSEAATISTSEAATTTEGTSVSESISSTTDLDTPVATSNDQTSQLATTTTKPTEVTTTQTAVTCAELSGIQWNGKCFWVNVTYPVYINYTQAAEICEEQNSHPANIYNSSTHYDQVMTYLRPNIPERLTSIWIWLGMTIDPSTKVISLYNGTTTNYEENWHPGGYPSSGTSFTQMAVAVNKDPGSIYQGMINFPPSYALLGILCEIEG